MAREGTKIKIVNQQPVLEFLAGFLIKKLHFTSGLDSSEVIKMFFDALNEEGLDSYTLANRRLWFQRIVNNMAKHHLHYKDDDTLDFIYNSNDKLRIHDGAFLFKDSFDNLFMKKHHDVDKKFVPELDLNNSNNMDNGTMLIKLLKEALAYVSDSKSNTAKRG